LILYRSNGSKSLRFRSLKANLNAGAPDEKLGAPVKNRGAGSAPI